MSMRVADTNDNDWFVYVLRNKRTGAVYTGVTNRPMHRLRAHQGHVLGGAKTTRRWVNKHGPDSVCMYLLVGPMDGTSARSLEHKWKQTRVPGTAGIQAFIA
jgi:predicted GIY-YIG superfamily endonuclease